MHTKASLNGTIWSTTKGQMPLAMALCRTLLLPIRTIPYIPALYNNICASVVDMAIRTKAQAVDSL